MSKEVTNSELFLWALYRLGGSDRFVDVEDVFVKAFEYAPNRLAWRTKKHLPDLKKCSKGLRDAEASRPGLTVKTKNGYERQLTVEGVEWIAVNEKRLANLLETGRVVQEPLHRPDSRALNALRRSEAFEEWQAGPPDVFQKWQVAEAFKCSPDSPTEVWVKRIEVLRAAANQASDEDLLAFLGDIQKRHSDWFRGG